MLEGESRGRSRFNDSTGKRGEADFELLNSGTFEPHLQSDESFSLDVNAERQAALQAELAKYVVQMDLDRPFADQESSCDFSVTQATDQESDDIDLARGEDLDRVGWSHWPPFGCGEPGRLAPTGCGSFCFFRFHEQVSPSVAFSPEPALS